MDKIDPNLGIGPDADGWYTIPLDDLKPAPIEGAIAPQAASLEGQVQEVATQVIKYISSFFGEE